MRAVIEVRAALSGEPRRHPKEVGRPACMRMEDTR
jgi:hypothetical protein